MHKQVVDGNRIEKKITYIDPSARFALPGERSDGVQCAWPIGQEMLSRHMLLLGGIGTGKSNAFYHLIRQLRYERNTNDIIFIFDTKGDYYEKFYQPGDVVISNDARATGSSHVDYWNIFNEITADDQFDENALEICTSLFEEKSNTPRSRSFPMQPAICCVRFSYIFCVTKASTRSVTIKIYVIYSTVLTVKPCAEFSDSTRTFRRCRHILKIHHPVKR